MGFWKQEKNEKNYDTEIALLNEKQNELSQQTDKNKSDIISFSLDFSEHKKSVGNDITEIFEYIKSLNLKISELEKWKEEQKKESVATETAKKVLPDTLTYEEVCKSLKDFSYLTTTSFKYYLYECGIMDLKINPIHNTYRISENFDRSESDIKKYIHTTDGVITFDKSILEYFINNPKELQDSIAKYKRKQDQYKESKQHLSEIQVTNYQKEIGRICGVDNGNGKNYNGKNWGMIYKRYEVDHKNWLKNYDLWAENFLKEHPNYKYDKPSRITYLVQECGDGDVLLKIACELFVA